LLHPQHHAIKASPANSLLNIVLTGFGLHEHGNSTDCASLFGPEDGTISLVFL